MFTDNSVGLSAFLHKHPDIEMFEVILPDVCGGMRGKWVTRDNIYSVIAGECKLPLGSLIFDVWGRDGDGWALERGDGFCRPDMRTLMPVPWRDRPTGQVLCSILEANRQPCSYDPRAILQNLVARFSARGMTPIIASDMDFYLFREERDCLGRPVHTQLDCIGGALDSGQAYGIDNMEEMSDLMHNLRDVCAAQGLPLDTLIKESAPSQYKISLHRNSDALASADYLIMLQRAIKGVARQRGLRATFMAKPFGNLAGSGMQLHCSLLNGDGNNALVGSDGNKLLYQAIAGCLATMHDSMLLFAPNFNSYRRYQHGSHAPVSPNWGYENRAVSVRVPMGKPEYPRFEHRVAGADANPYLVIAATLAGMLLGIEKGLMVPSPVAGNSCEKLQRGLPRYWQDALAQFESSEFISSNFGRQFQRVFSALKRREIHEFDRQVTPLEYEACL